jgi:hypothetical protein
VFFTSLLLSTPAVADDADWEAWLDCAVDGAPAVLEATAGVEAAAFGARAWHTVVRETTIEAGAGASVVDGAPRGGLAAGIDLRDRIGGEQRDDLASAGVVAAEARLAEVRATIGAELMLAALAHAFGSQTVAAAEQGVELLEREIALLEAGSSLGVGAELLRQVLSVTNAQAQLQSDIASVEIEAALARIRSGTSCAEAPPSSPPSQLRLLDVATDVVDARRAVASARSQMLRVQASAQVSGSRSSMTLGGAWEIEAEQTVLATFRVEWGGRDRARLLADSLRAQAAGADAIAQQGSGSMQSAMVELSVRLTEPAVPDVSHLEQTISAAVSAGVMSPIDAARLRRDLLQSQFDFIQLRATSGRALLELVLDQGDP